MPNIDFEKIDSLYKFKCFLGICVICIPQIFIYFISCESIAKSYILAYKFLNWGFYILIAISLTTIYFGVYLIYTGLEDWRVKQQDYLDKKLKQDVQLQIASLNEINKKNESKFYDDTIIKTKKNEKSVEKTRIYYEKIEKCFLEYLNKSLGMRYSIYSNIKLNIGVSFNNREILICDAVAVSNSNEKDIIYELKFGDQAIKSTTYHAKVLKRYIEVYTKNYQRQCTGQLAYILEKNEMKKLNASLLNQLDSNNSNLVEIKIYEYEDILKYGIR